MTDTTGRAQTSAPPGCNSHKTDHLTRLHKIEGQVRGVARMVDEDRYCIEVLTQITAATHALREVALSLLDDHVRHCVTDVVREGPETGVAKLDELTAALHRAMRP